MALVEAGMWKKPLEAIEAHFSKVSDPRVERTKEHKLNDIIPGQIINIDGKQLRGSKDKVLGKRAIYMVSAWAEANV